MLKYLFLLVLAVAAANVSAEIFKCKGADGKTQFSDTPCKAGNASQVVPDRAPITDQQRYDAQQRALQMQGEAAALDGDRAAAISAYQAQQQRQDAVQGRRAAESKIASNDADAIDACVRDVERRGASQNVEAEMIAACRTAGLVQRSTGLSGDVVSNCVKRVERTGASEKEKARQLATCHGGDVQPEPVVAPSPPPQRPPAVVGGCFNGKCSDQYGNSYSRDVVGNIVRSDGRRCRQYGKSLECD